MLNGTAPVLKAAQQGCAPRALGFGREVVALGACLLPDMPPAGAGASQIGSFGVTGNGGHSAGESKPSRTCLAAHG
jgi:hypothetical protein